MAELIDMTGKTVGRLTIIGRAPSVNGMAAWHCVCSCGNQRIAKGKHLRCGWVQSCGCYMRELRSVNGKKHATHNATGTPEFSSWAGMMDRCHNEKSNAYKLYGARGLHVCERWHDFATFLADMGPRPPGTSIDRIDNARGYEPGNCRWATATQQARNRGCVKLSEEKAQFIRESGETNAELAAMFGVTASAISAVRNGKSWRISVNGLPTPTGEGER